MHLEISRRHKKSTASTVYVSIFLLLLMILPPVATSDPALVQVGPNDKQFVWDFSNSSDYILNGVTIENGSLRLIHSDISYSISTQQDFNNGTLVNLDATTLPGSLIMQKLAPEVFQLFEILDDANSRDSYIENETPEISHGSEHFLMVGNDAENHSYRALLAIDPSLLAEIPWDAQLVSAKLSIYQESSTYSGSITACAGTANWSEGNGNWNDTLANIWVNETEAVKRTNEPVIVEIAVRNISITDPDAQLILYDGQGIEYPSRILNWTVVAGDLILIKLGFPVSIGPLESKYFALKLHDSSSTIPFYRNVSLSPTLIWHKKVGDVDCGPAVADLDGDGVLDIIAFDSLPQNPRIAAYSLSGSLLWTYETPSKENLASPLVVADVNNDGSVEILFTSKNTGIKVLDSMGNLLPEYQIGGYDGEGMPAVADLNNDGVKEIVFSCIAAASTVACIDGSTGAINWQITMGSTAKAIAIGNFNSSDGLEIAVAHWSGRLSIYDYSGNLLLTKMLSNNDFGKTLGVADLNGDSIDDVILGENIPASKIFAVNGATAEILFTYTNATSVRYCDGLAVGDLNNDGLNETIALARENTKCSVVMISNVGIELWKVQLPDLSYGAITLADVNGDGVQEILIGDRAAKVNIIDASGNYLGSVIASFSKATDKIDNAPVIADMNGDATLEMVTLSDVNLTLIRFPGFSYDWRMRGRDDTLGSSLRQTNSHDGVLRLTVEASSVNPPMMAVNWTHATDLAAWATPGGDFNSTGFDSFGTAGSGIWQDINITTIIADWLSSGRSYLEAIYLVANDNSQGLVTFASTENPGIIRHPMLTVTYRVTRYVSFGIFTSTILGEASTTHWTGLSAYWNKTENTDIVFEFRSGNSTSPGDSSWGSWLTASLVENGTVAAISAYTRYIQLRAFFTNTNISFTPSLDELVVYGLRYAPHGYAITSDAILSEIIQSWNRSWVIYDSYGGSVTLNFSTNSGSNWVTVGPDGDISIADKSTGKLRLRIDIWGRDYPSTSAFTPIVHSAVASYILYSTPLVPPVISPRIPDQVVLEDSPPWFIDLSLYISDANDPQSMLRWYVVNESMVAVSGENNTGNMMMTLSVPINVNGIDTLTIIVVDSTGMSCCQDFNVTIIPVNDEPVISPIPTFSVDPGVPFDFDFTMYVSDIETPRNLLNLTIVGANATFVTMSGLIGRFLIPQELNGTIVQFVLRVDDGDLWAERPFLVSVTALAPQLPPVISPEIPDQYKNEDTPPWSVDLSLYLSDPNEPLTTLRWYVLNESFVSVGSENQTGNMNMVLSVPENVFGTDGLTLIVVDSTGRSARQNFNVIIAPVNDPPVIRAISDFTVHYDYPYTLNLTPYVSDIDNPLSDLRLSSTGANSSYVTFNRLNATFLLPKALNGSTVRFTIVVSDGLATASTSFNVLVSPDFPPRLIKPLPDVTLRQGELKSNLFNLSDYFSDIDDTTLFFAVGNVHVTITINQKTRMVSFLAPTDWYGVEDATFRAIDPDNARAEDTIAITVLRGYEPPTIRQIPDLRVRYDSEYRLDLATYVEDPDTPISELKFETNMSSSYIYFDGRWMCVLFPYSAKGQTYSVLLTADDGTSTAQCAFKVIVGNDYPPGCHMLPDWSFEEDHPQSYPGLGSLSDWFYDEDDAMLNYQVRIWDHNVTAQIVMSGPVIRIDFRQSPNWFGETKMTIKATDGSQAFAEMTVKLTVIPVNDIPTISAFGPIYVTTGKETVIDISENISDVEDPKDVLLLSTDMPQYAHGLSGKMYFLFPSGYTGLANSTTVQLTVFVRDLDGGVNSTNLTVIVLANTDDTRQAEQIYLWWLIGTIATLAGLLLFIFLSRKIQGPFVIQDVMLIHNNGLLLARCQHGAGVKVDDDVFSGMLTAILDFVDESFKREEQGMRRFEFKDYSVLLHRGRNSFLAVAYSGAPPRDIDSRLSGLMTRIENIYGTRIENFSGDSATELSGIEIVLSDFIAENSKKPKNQVGMNSRNGGNAREPAHSP
ncbi:MAG: DNRLRE domain-containing protein [Thermoplasmata archaeon]